MITQTAYLEYEREAEPRQLNQLTLNQKGGLNKDSSNNLLGIRKGSSTKAPRTAYLESERGAQTTNQSDEIITTKRNRRQVTKQDKEQHKTKNPRQNQKKTKRHGLDDHEAC